MELKHQLSEGKLYRCHILARGGKEDYLLEEESLVIANNAEEARNKAEDWFKEENPGAEKHTTTLSNIAFVII